MEGYEQKLHISDTAFEGMRADADRVLQRLIKNMVEKDSFEGKVTITIDIALIPEYIPNHDPKIEGESRRVLTPKFSHKVGSVMQIKNEAKGDTNYDGMELVWDDQKNEYVLRPIANTAQMSIFDAEFRDVVSEDDEEVPALSGRRIAELPGPTDDVEDADFTEVVVGEESKDADDSLTPLPFEVGYGYEEPEEEEDEEDEDAWD